MSGSSGGGYVPPQRTKFDCETSIIRTNVSTIDLAVLAKHKQGDILEVIIGQNDALLLEDGNGEILGAILHLNTVDIIICIGKGTEYEAEIIKINTPACQVEIKRK
jgi:hypothetical protein